MFKPEDVRKIAALSSLELTDEEVGKFVGQFTIILKYFEKLKEVDVGELADRDDQLQVNGREDICSDSDVSPDQFSPYLEGKFFKVPRVIEKN
ncbi:MAG: Asp-tRNA(Asn)/Glu-tRNA(Gln) amidotransferase GatCAB subunit C [Deltaproteobacteria bacterium]|nr:Asp-tRNA(Asn)/Glu-tRNA(Gln) amidotransferase GatCAB subunit C [Deltaproteobacteria bacterium]